MRNEIAEKLNGLPGFLYQIGRKHYFIGRWICTEATELEQKDACDMYHLLGGGTPDREGKLYFGKCRAYADLALTPPPDLEGTKEKIHELVAALTEEELVSAIRSCETWQRDHKAEIEAFREKYTGACDGRATERILELAGLKQDRR